MGDMNSIFRGLCSDNLKSKMKKSHDQCLNITNMSMLKQVHRVDQTLRPIQSGSFVACGSHREIHSMLGWNSPTMPTEGKRYCQELHFQHVRDEEGTQS